MLASFGFGHWIRIRRFCFSCSNRKPFGKLLQAVEASSTQWVIYQKASLRKDLIQISREEIPLYLLTEISIHVTNLNALPCLTAQVDCGTRSCDFLPCFNGPDSGGTDDVYDCTELEDGFYPDPLNCLKFFQCIGDGATGYICGEGGQWRKP